MSIAYFDTSVVVAYYAPEPHSAVAERRLTAASARVVSDLTLVEFATAMMRKVRDGVLTEKAAHSVQRMFLGHIADQFYVVTPLSRMHFEAAALHASRLGTVHPIRALDAIHMAVALSEDLRLVTADRRLATTAAAAGVVADFIGE